jgi:hypothetical protein
VSDHLIGGIERPGGAAGFGVGQALRELGVNDAALGGRIVFVGGGKFGAIDYESRGDSDTAAGDLHVKSTRSPSARPMADRTPVGWNRQDDVAAISERQIL